MIENVAQIFMYELTRKKDAIRYAADLTLGNGGDSKRIIEHCRNLKILYAFDIQESAFAKAKEKLGSSEIIQYIHDGHENVTKFVPTSLDFITMNLGYLPGGDKNITTLKETTVKAIDGSLSLLNSSGTMIITVYPGHQEGYNEKIAILQYAKELDQKQYTCRHVYFVNQIHHPPEVIIIEKR